MIILDIYLLHYQLHRQLMEIYLIQTLIMKLKLHMKEKNYLEKLEMYTRILHHMKDFYIPMVKVKQLHLLQVQEKIMLNHMLLEKLQVMIVVVVPYILKNYQTMMDLIMYIKQIQQIQLIQKQKYLMVFIQQKIHQFLIIVVLFIFHF